jgi:phage terminase small subunit
MSRRQYLTAADGLSERQRRFVEEYLIDLNVAAAARRSGYSPKSAHCPGKFLTPAVQAAIETAIAARVERVRFDADKVIAELAKIAFANMLDFVTVDPDGSPRIDFRRLSREDGAAIQTMTIDYGRDVFAHRRKKALPEPCEASAKQGATAQTRRAARRVHIRLADKHAALVELAKHLGILRPDALGGDRPTVIQVVTGVPRAGDFDVDIPRIAQAD